MKNISKILVSILSIGLFCVKAYSFTDEDAQMLKSIGPMKSKILLHEDQWQVRK